VRNAEYRVIVMDEDLFEASPAAAAGVGELAEGALTVFLNFGIANSDRVIREVKAALRRRERDEATARHSANLQLQGELSNDLTGILVSAQTAMNILICPGRRKSGFRISTKSPGSCNCACRRVRSRGLRFHTSEAGVCRQLGPS
jgi:hypothetical protein